jgi:hypothetical protein
MEPANVLPTHSENAPVPPPQPEPEQLPFAASIDDNSSRDAPQSGTIHVHVHASTKWTEPLTLSTFALAVITLVLVMQTHFDAKEAVETMNRTNGKIIEAQVKTNDGTISAQKAINREILQNQKDLARQSMQSAKAQNDKGMALNAQLAWIEQRPWVTVSRFNVSEKLDEKLLDVTFWLQNTGKTPALATRADIELFLWNTEPAPAEINGLTSIPTSFDVAPAVTSRNFSYHWPVDKEASISDYRDGRLRLYIVAILQYEDMYKLSHRTQVCAYHLVGNSADQMTYCSPGLNYMQ